MPGFNYDEIFANNDTSAIAPELTQVIQQFSGVNQQGTDPVATNPVYQPQASLPTNPTVTNQPYAPQSSISDPAVTNQPYTPPSSLPPQTLQNIGSNLAPQTQPIAQNIGGVQQPPQNIGGVQPIGSAPPGINTQPGLGQPPNTLPPPTPQFGFPNIVPNQNGSPPTGAIPVTDPTQPKVDEYGNLVRDERFYDFYKSPGYQFRLNEGLKGVGRMAAARGGFASGRTLKEISRYGSDYAAGEYGNYMNRLQSLAGLGQTSAQQGALLGQYTANNIAQQYAQGGQYAASGYIGQNQALSRGVGNLSYLAQQPNFFGNPAGSQGGGG